MLGARVLGIVMGMLLVSGCAGPKSRQELARLRSQVGLLDERVTQLERSTISGGFSESSSLIESSAPIGIAGAGTVSSSKQASSGKPSSSSLKPTTREIQQALKNAGFYQGAIDGKMGPVTKDAVREFQRVHGLRDDGVVGKQTWSKLRAYADLSSGEANAAEILK